MENAREHMQLFWQSYTDNPTINDMLLDNNAKQVEPHEKSEILQMLPDLRAKNVLELGAGIGRFTGEIAQSARHVIAVDFMEAYISKNKTLHGDRNNITWLQEDVTQLQFESQSFDVVFSNWLLMYLNDTEVKALFQNSLKWLKKGGILFFRESCFYPSGDKKNGKTNPTIYRKPSDYDELLQNTSISSGNEPCFKILSRMPLESYIEHRNNPNQICWTIQKVEQEAQEKV